MSSLARFALAASAIIGLSLAGCSTSHTTDTDTDGGASCDAGPPLACVASCGSDVVTYGECVMGMRVCPSGTVDIRTCEPRCVGAPPSSTCRCEGTTWVCDDACPPGINPWDPTSPGSACEPEGRHCQSGGTDECSSFLSCDCEGGHWECLFAEPDPSCWCGRQPDEGSRCNEEGATCGECCPTPGGTGWPAMTCEDGHWQPAGCPEIECPPVVAECPVDRAAALGTLCAIEGTVCGNACCGRGFMCSGGRWIEGPDVDCIVCDESATYECGPGTCERGQACTSQCGPDDGIVYSCTQLDPSCGESCDCAPARGLECRESDGHVYLSDGGFCG